MGPFLRCVMVGLCWVNISSLVASERSGLLEDPPVDLSEAREGASRPVLPIILENKKYVTKFTDAHLAVMHTSRPVAERNQLVFTLKAREDLEFESGGRKYRATADGEALFCVFLGAKGLCENRDEIPLPAQFYWPSNPEETHFTAFMGLQQWAQGLGISSGGHNQKSLCDAIHAAETAARTSS